VSASAGDRTATIRFDAPAWNGGSTITRYVVTSNPGRITASGTSSPIIITGLTNQVSYTFTVTAASEAGTGPVSAQSNAVIPTATSVLGAIPGAPTQLVVDGLDEQASLSWQAPVTSGSSTTVDYLVEYKKSTDSTWTIVARQRSVATRTRVTGLDNGTSYDFRVRAVNATRVGPPSQIVSTTPLAAVIRILRVSTTVSDNAATISWTTNKASSSQVEFGGDSTYGRLTRVSSSTTGVINHTVELRNLHSCTRYHYRVISRDAKTGAMSNDQSFTTSGCVGQTAVISQSAMRVSADAGGTLQFRSSTTSPSPTVVVNVPPNYTAQTTVIQIKRLSTAPVEFTGTPALSLRAIPTQVYDVKAMNEVGELVTRFDRPISFSVSYTDEEVDNLIEESLVLYRWSDDKWSRLDGCVVDSSINTISCTTTSFSVFTLFGEPRDADPSSSGYPAGTVDGTAQRSSHGDTPQNPLPMWLWGLIPAVIGLAAALPNLRWRRRRRSA
jgi:hypothetical protein